MRQDIAVDDVRRSVSFFGSTAGEGGWRVAIVDAVDELNAAGANAVTKLGPMEGAATRDELDALLGQSEG